MDNGAFDQVKSDIHRARCSHNFDLEKLSAVENGRAKLAVSSLIQ